MVSRIKNNRQPELELSQAGIDPFCDVTVLDPYGVEKGRQLAVERPLTIYLDRYEIVTLMTLGTEPELLTIGYLYNQGLIKSIEELASVQVDWSVYAASVTTKNRDFKPDDRLAKKTVTTGCGQGTQFGDWLAETQKLRVADQEVKQSTIYQLLNDIRNYNHVYRAAGSVHGCAICDEERVLFFNEDVGRHNAVDTLSGRMLIEGLEPQDKLFYTTGRLTSEMVMKVAHMGIPTLFSRSGLTGLGVEIANNTNVMLIARCRGRQFIVTTQLKRFIMDAQLNAVQKS